MSIVLETRCVDWAKVVNTVCMLSQSTNQKSSHLAGTAEENSHIKTIMKVIETQGRRTALSYLHSLSNDSLKVLRGDLRTQGW